MPLPDLLLGRLGLPGATWASGKRGEDSSWKRLSRHLPLRKGPRPAEDCVNFQEGAAGQDQAEPWPGAGGCPAHSEHAMGAVVLRPGVKAPERPIQGGQGAARNERASQGQARKKGRAWQNTTGTTVAPRPAPIPQLRGLCSLCPRAENWFPTGSLPCGQAGPCLPEASLSLTGKASRVGNH